MQTSSSSCNCRPFVRSLDPSILSIHRSIVAYYYVLNFATNCRRVHKLVACADLAREIKRFAIATFFDLPTEKQQTNGNPRAAKPRQPRAAGRSAGAPGAPKADDVPGQPSLAVDRLNAQLSSTWSRRPGAAIPSLGGPLVRPRWLFGETRGTKVRAARPEAPQPAREEVQALREELPARLDRLCVDRRGREVGVLARYAQGKIASRDHENSFLEILATNDFLDLLPSSRRDGNTIAKNPGQ